MSTEATSTYPTIDPEVKQKWAEALRSGDYKQTTGRLVRVKDDERGYCCLGVLCELHPDVELVRAPSGRAATFSGSDKINEMALPDELLKQIGLSHEAQEALVNLNDSRGASFEEIADWIEENL